VVRAKVFGFMQRDPAIPGPERLTDRHKARAYFRLAAEYVGGGPPFALVCFMGRMGAGKSYRASWLARQSGWPRLSSDQIRQEMAGERPEGQAPDAYGQGIYTANFTQTTYEAILSRARDRLSQGGSAIIDASFQKDHWRRRAFELAQETGAGFMLVEVVADREVVLERLRQRQAQGGSDSEGREELLADQERDWQPMDAWLEAGQALRVDGGLEPEQGLAPLLEWLRAQGVDLAGE
jgi:predicted kinase